MNDLNLLPLSEQSDAVRVDPKRISEISDPHPTVQFSAVDTDPEAIQYLDEPCAIAVATALRRKPSTAALIRRMSDTTVSLIATFNPEVLRERLTVVKGRSRQIMIEAHPETFWSFKDHTDDEKTTYIVSRAKTLRDSPERYDVLPALKHPSYNVVFSALSNYRDPILLDGTDHLTDEQFSALLITYGACVAKGLPRQLSKGARLRLCRKSKVIADQFCDLTIHEIYALGVSLGPYELRAMSKDLQFIEHRVRPVDHSTVTLMNEVANMISTPDKMVTCYAACHYWFSL